MRFFFNKHSKQQTDTLESETSPPGKVNDQLNDQDELASVIALAIHMYVNEVREYENAVVTIQKVIKPYSPWSSKIYGLRQQPMYIPGSRSRIR